MKPETKFEGILLSNSIRTTLKTFDSKFEEIFTGCIGSGIDIFCPIPIIF